MSPGGLVALALVAIALIGIGSLLMPPRRRAEPASEPAPAPPTPAPPAAAPPAAEPAPERPMTVADLVRMRTAAAAQATADPDPDPGPVVADVPPAPVEVVAVRPAVAPDQAYGGDTPWARGARMIAGGATTPYLPAPEEEPEEPEPPVAWASWPDWADVDALEDGARATPGPSGDTPASGGGTVPVRAETRHDIDLAEDA